MSKSYKHMLRLRMILTARCTEKQRLVWILKELTAAPELAKPILELIENASKTRRGRPGQTVGEFDHNNRFALEVALLKREKKVSTAKALREVSEKNDLEENTLAKRYQRYQRDLEMIAKLLSPHKNHPQ